MGGIKAGSYFVSRAWDKAAKEQTRRDGIDAVSQETAPSAALDLQRAARVAAEASLVKTKCIIDPRNSKVLPYWDLVTGLALAFTAIATPYEVSYLPVQVDALFWINRLIDVIFITDLALNFFLAFPTDSTQSQQGAHWVEDRRLIVQHYLRGWFWIDSFSTATSAFDIITVIQQSEEEGGGTSLSKYKAFRIVRVLRLAKLLRLLRGTRLLQRWETRMRINYGMLALIQSMAFVVLFAHWSACCWMLQVSVRDSLSDTWVYNFEYCIDDPIIHANKTDYTPPADLARYTVRPNHGFDGQYLCMAPVEIYAAAFYWAVMTITSVGYGDIIATPRQWTEQTIASMLMLSGAFVWSQVVATFCGIISTMSPGTTDFRLTLDSLNSYMSLHSLPDEMRQRLRDFFHRTRHLWQSNASHQVLMRMSPALQGEVLLHTNAKWLSNVPWLAHEDPRFLTQLILQLEPAVFAPSEVIRSTALHIVNSGVAIHGGNLIRHGGVWGSDMLIAAPHLRSRTLVRAITYVEVYYIERDKVLQIAQAFGETLERIRRRTRYLALQRSIVLIAKVSRSLGSHHSKAEVQREKTRKKKPDGRDSSPPVGGRWKAAYGVWRSHQDAEKSFLKKHIAFKGSTEEGRRTGMLLGSELDQRVEKAREQQLCTNLFAIAAAARCASSSNLVASAPTAEKGAGADQGGAAGTSTSNGSASNGAAVDAKAESWKAAWWGGGASSEDTAHAAPLKPADSTTTGCERTASSSSKKTSFCCDHDVSNGTSIPASMSNGVFARAGPPPTRSPDLRPDVDAPAPPQPQQLAGGGRSGSGLGGGSFLKRRAAARRERANARSGTQAKLSGAGMEADDDDAMDEGRPLRSRPASQSGRIRRSGHDAMAARIDSLAASNEAMAQQLSQLTACLSAHMGVTVAPSAAGGSSGAALEA